MKKIVKREALTNVHHLNLIKAVFVDENQEMFDYFIATRRKFGEMAIDGCIKIDAVRILPYYKKNGKIFVLLIKEFRYAINDYIYGLPAGLADANEEPCQAAIREVSEEIGATVLDIKKVLDASYTSAGFSDEMVMCFEAEVKCDKQQKLDFNEEIEVVEVDLEQIIDFISGHNFGLQSALQLREFYYKMKLLELEYGK